MSITLFSCVGGKLILPSGATVFIDRRFGGNLILDPARPVWDRTEFSAVELTQWSFLVSAAAKAMLTTLPALKHGCINYWDAGNWALHPDAEPKGAKTGSEHRKLHMHLLGRSPLSEDPNWTWGEAPKFASFANRIEATVRNQRLNQDECRTIVEATGDVLRTKYGFSGDQMHPWTLCTNCGYPTAEGSRCEECAS